MLALIQWTRAHPQDWEPLDITRAADWRNLPKKPEPTVIFDPLAAGADDPGWIFSVNIQGVRLEGFDAYSVTASGAGLVATVWNYDLVDYPGERFAMVWTFLLPALDARYGAVNTRQSLTVYDERSPSPWVGQSTTSGPVTVLPWAQFTPPAANMTRYGIWLDEALFAAHFAARAERGWREWIGP